MSTAKVFAVLYRCARRLCSSIAMTSPIHRQQQSASDGTCMTPSQCYWTYIIISLSDFLCSFDSDLNAKISRHIDVRYKVSKVEAIWSLKARTDKLKLVYQECQTYQTFSLNIIWIKKMLCVAIGGATVSCQARYSANDVLFKRGVAIACCRLTIHSCHCSVIAGVAIQKWHLPMLRKLFQRHPHHQPQEEQRIVLLNVDICAQKRSFASSITDCAVVNPWWQPAIVEL